MTDKNYVESLLSQIENLNQDNIRLRRENKGLEKNNKHLGRVIKGYKEKLPYNNYKRKAARREFYR